MKKHLIFLLATLALSVVACNTSPSTSTTEQTTNSNDFAVVSTDPATPIEQTQPELQLQSYTNEELGYTFQYPADYQVDTSRLVNPMSKSVEVYPLTGKVAYTPDYFDIHLDERGLDYLLAEVFSHAPRTEIEFGGQAAYQFLPMEEENSIVIVIPYKDVVYVVMSGRTDLPEVNSILKSFTFL